LENIVVSLLYHYDTGSANDLYLNEMKKIAPIILVLSAFLSTGIIHCCKSDSQNENPQFADTVFKSANNYYILGDTLPEHTLDIYYPKYSNNNAVIIFIGGEEWSEGDKNQFESVAYTLSKLHNYVVVVINYRLSNPNGVFVVHPRHIQDIAFAYKWVTANIESYGGNPEDIFLFGYSAGGHLASLLATDLRYLQQAGCSEKNIRGLITMSGLYSLCDFIEYPLNPIGLHSDQVLKYKTIFALAFGSNDTSIIKPASPSSYVNDSLLPMLILYSEIDRPGFAPDAMNFYALLKEAGAEAAHVYKITQSMYSAQTWQTAFELAGNDPEMTDYVGHYAEIVAINENDRNKMPFIWIVDFINENKLN
jgi:acetyl esterase/lipase